MKIVRTGCVAVAVTALVASAGPAVAAAVPNEVPHGTTAAVRIIAPTITIKSFGFTVWRSVRPGARVVVRNRDSVTHSVTSNLANTFNVVIPARTTTSFVAPRVVGRYRFHCRFHTEMHGVLVVRR